MFSSLIKIIAVRKYIPYIAILYFLIGGPAPNLRAFFGKSNNNITISSNDEHGISANIRQTLNKVVAGESNKLPLEYKLPKQFTSHKYQFISSETITRLAKQAMNGPGSLTGKSGIGRLNYGYL
ncbi:MAG: hypothetical protein KC414_12205 [Romboutsia sp.]|nr:hypothetical protein [Romboutsia sp.]